MSAVELTEAEVIAKWGREHHSPAVRFWTKVEKTSTCWNWTGFIGTNGYGQFSVGRRLINAHRWSYEDQVGPISEGLVLDHLCRNRACVNPKHLEPVTQQINAMRGQEAEGRNETCRNGHPRTPENTRHTRDGARYCAECKRIRDRKYDGERRSA